MLIESMSPTIPTGKRPLKIGVGVIAYNVANPLLWLINSLADENGKTTNGNEVYLYLHGHSTKQAQPEVWQICNDAEVGSMKSERYHWVHFWDHGKNRGLAASWNNALIAGYDRDKCDVVLLVNDDIQFLPGSLDKMAEYAVAHRDKYMITVMGYHHHYASNAQLGQQPFWGFGFSCFAINPIGWETIGCFDENFAPIYFEDCDFGQRGYLAGLQMDECKDAIVVHWGSLSSQGQGQQEINDKANPLLKEYYTKKWGCLPGLGEQFKTPFNLCKPGVENREAIKSAYGITTPDLRISPETRHHPYGPLWDRYDIEGRETKTTDDYGPSPISKVLGLALDLMELEKYNPLLIGPGDPLETTETGSFEQVPLPSDADRFPIFYEAADDQHRIETRALLHLCSQTTGAILEIGTHVGVKAMELAKNFPNRTIVTVDWTGEPTMHENQRSEQPTDEEVGVRCAHLKNVIRVNTNSQKMDYADIEALSGRIGLIFIDGDHSIEGVLQDSSHALKYASSHGAVIVWHDFADYHDHPWIGVKKVLTDSVENGGLHLKEIIGTRTAYTTQWAHPTAPLPQQMPQGYVQPSQIRYPFRPNCGGNSIWDHMERLADFARLCDGVIVEVGSGCGDGSTHAFDLGLAANDRPYSHYHISVCIHPVAGDWEPTAPYWEMVVGDSREQSTVDAVRNELHWVATGPSARDFPYGIDHTPHIIYIDTEHTYATLKRELEIWPDLGDENTLYLFHDTVCYPEMAKAIEESVAVGGRFHDTHDYRILWHTCCGLGALVPKAGWPK